MATVGKTLLIVGLILLGGAIVWWYSFFEQVLGERVKEASDCFYYTTDICSLGNVVGVVGDIPTYSPVVFWAAAAAMTAGIAFIALAPRRS